MLVALSLINGIRKWTRSERKAQRNLGVIALGLGNSFKQYRNAELERFDAYYENRQYANLVPWDQNKDAFDQHIPVRRRAPRLRVAFAKTLSQRVTSKLIGPGSFPTFKVEESPDDQAFLKAVIREAKLEAKILEPIRRCVNAGSVFVRFYLTGGAMQVEHFNSKVCYPTRTESGELESVSIKYVFEDKDDLDTNGSPKKKWYRLDLGTDSEILYDNPEFEEGKEPEFQEVERMDHGLGFVQGEWIRTSYDSEDGYGLVADITDFIDELCYSLSQSSQAVSYNQDPQLTVNSLSEEETETLIRSAAKIWNLGREGKAGFIESNMNGVQRALELRDKVRLNIQDISRVVLLDPEKIVGNAQSAKAMEILHGPLVDLVNELRSPIGDSLKSLVLKMALAMLIADRNGIDVPVVIPAGYAPQSLNIELDWNPIFQQTMEDLDRKVGVAVKASSANIISRKTMTRWLAKDFGIEDVDAEILEIADQPIINPFGAF